MINYNILVKGKNGKVTFKSLEKFLDTCDEGYEIWNAWEKLVYEHSEEYPMTNKTFYKGLILAYQYGKVYDMDSCREMFSNLANFGDGGWYKYADKQDKDFFNNLEWNENGSLTVYRGCSMQEVEGGELGFSWTPNRGVAEFFAFRYGTKDSALVSTTIYRGYVDAVITERNEDEIILADVGDYEVVATEPSKAYEEYQAKRRAEVMNLINKAGGAIMGNGGSLYSLDGTLLAAF